MLTLLYAGDDYGFDCNKMSAVACRAVRHLVKNDGNYKIIANDNFALAA